MDIVITNIGQLITPVECTLDGYEGVYTLQVTQDATLCIQNGRITDDLPPSRGSEQVQTIDAGGGVIMPGLIDPFWVMPQLPAWMDGLPESKLPERDLLSWSLRLFERALHSGVTMIEVKCPHDAAFAGLSALGYLGQHWHPRVVGTLLASLPEGGTDRDRSMSSLIGEVIPEVRRRRLATFCDMGWDSQDASITEASAVLRAAGGAGLRAKLHIQTPIMMNEVCDLALSLEAAAIGCASHLPFSTVKQLAAGHVVPVYLPGLPDKRTGQHLGVRALLDQGVPIAIGSGNGLTDSRPKSMWSVLASAMDHMDMSLAEAIVACTLNNAMALEMSHELGSLETGKLADLILLDLVDYRELETAVMLPPVSMVMVNGELLHSP
jgi:imidazolonepropionase